MWFVWLLCIWIGSSIFKFLCSWCTFISKIAILFISCIWTIFILIASPFFWNTFIRISTSKCSVLCNINSIFSSVQLASGRISPTWIHFPRNMNNSPHLQHSGNLWCYHIFETEASKSKVGERNKKFDYSLNPIMLSR